MSSFTDLVAREPVRVYLYGVIGAACAAAVVFGWLSSEQVPVLLALAAAVLAVPTVEVTRSKVTPYDEGALW